MSIDKVAEARARRDEMASKVAEAKIAAAEASALEKVAPKEEKVAAALVTARAKAAVEAAQIALKDAEKALKAAEAESAKAAKKATDEAEKKAKADEKRMAAEFAAANEAERAAAVAENPFLAEEVDWPALGRWLAAKAKDRVCYVEGAGWGDWTGSHWEFASKPLPRLLDRVRRAYGSIVSPIVVELNKNHRSATFILEHAQGALTLPRHLFNSPAIAHLVAFRDCTVNLRTGQRMPHDPKHYMTGCLQCDYDEQADADRVEDAFARFWPDDPATAECFQTSIGYAMTGETSAKRMFFLVGNQDASLSNGDNGKSMVEGALVKLFGFGQGGLGAAVKSGIIVDTGDRDANSHDGARVPLIWRRFAMASEFRQGATVNAGEFNVLSGGDVISARPPHAEFAIPFVNVASMFFMMNTVARFKTWDRATRVRLTPFEFNQSFYDADKVPEGGQVKEIGLKEWLEEEGGPGQRALALYAVRGAMRFYAHNGGRAGNFPNSPAVEAFRDRILAAANPYVEMFNEWFEFSPDADTKQAAVSALLMRWLGHRPTMHEKDLFIAALKGAGVTGDPKIKGIYYWRGVGLTNEGRKIANFCGHPAADFWRKPEGDVVQMSAVAAE